MENKQVKLGIIGAMDVEVATLMELLPDDRMGWSIRLLLGIGMRT